MDWILVVAIFALQGNSMVPSGPPKRFFVSSHENSLKCIAAARQFHEAINASIALEPKPEKLGFRIEFSCERETRI